MKARLLIVLMLIWQVLADLPSDHVPIRVNTQQPSKPAASPGDDRASAGRRRPHFTHTPPAPTPDVAAQPRIPELSYDHARPSPFTEPLIPAVVDNSSLLSINGTCSLYEEGKQVWQICPYGRVVRGNVNEFGMLRDTTLIGMFERWTEDASLVQLFTQGDACSSQASVDQNPTNSTISSTSLQLTIRCNDTIAVDVLPITRIAQISPCRYHAWIHSKAACNFTKQVEVVQQVSFKQLIESTLQDQPTSAEQLETQSSSTVEQCLSAMLDVARFVDNVERAIHDPLRTPDEIKRLCAVHWRRILAEHALVDQVDELMVQNWDEQRPNEAHQAQEASQRQSEVSASEQVVAE